MKSGVSPLFRTFLKSKFKTRPTDLTQTAFVQDAGTAARREVFFVWRKIIEPRAVSATRAQASVTSEAS